MKKQYRSIYDETVSLSLVNHCQRELDYERALSHYLKVKRIHRVLTTLMLISLSLCISCSVEYPETEIKNADESETESVTETVSERNESERLKSLTTAYLVESVFHYKCTSKKRHMLFYETSSDTFYKCQDDKTWREVSLSSAPGTNDKIISNESE